MPLQETSGNLTTDAYGGGAAAVPNYIEDVFSTYLYTGNGSTQTINNSIDLAGKGGLVWAKNRSSAGYDHVLTDTIRGAGNILSSNNTAASQSLSNTLTAFGSTGFTLGSDPYGIINYSGQTYASWTFRKQPKFFDVVTYTRDSSTYQTISHSLGSIPGCILVKATSGASNWAVYHRSIPTGYLTLNSTNANTEGFGFFQNVTSTSFETAIGAAGVTYVAYVFAHNAGGFGLTGTDNVISCGSFTTNGSGAATVSLGYEPQMLIVKRTDAAEDWFMVDNMRGWFASPSVNTATLKPNTSGAEFTWGAVFAPSATGFTYNYNPSSTYIYIAIRRGPMKVPTSGTSVFSPVINTGNDSATTITSNFPVDLAFRTTRNVGIGKSEWDRLRGSVVLETNTTAAESSNSSITFDNSTGINVSAGFNGTFNFINWMFRRAPSFFDEVCYTYDGSTTTFNHNLGVPPELIITKQRNQVYDWYSWGTVLGANQFIILNSNAAATAYTFNTTVTSTTFNDALANSGRPKVAYLFASCPGVSKVGSYTGNGSTQTINCGFTGGARFVLIKRTDAAGDWYVYDTARGMTTLTDPYLLLNSTAAESATLGSVTTVSTGFAVNASILAAINTSGGSYIFLAVS